MILGLLLLAAAGTGKINAAFAFALFVPIMTIALVLTTMKVAESIRASEQAQRVSESLQKAIVDATPECVKIVDRDYSLVFMNAAGLAMVEATSSSEIIGSNVLDLIAPEHRSEWQTMHERICACETASWEFDIVTRSGRRLAMETQAVPLQRGELSGAQHLAVTRDITAHKMDRERERLLAREVDHRSKNLLAVVQSIARLSRADDATTLRDAFIGRIDALARSHGLLASSNWNGADLRTLIREELAPYAGADQVYMAGPDLELGPAAAQGIGLAVHELATNALKYGALSRDGGQIELHWAMTETAPHALLMTWIEKNGATVARPGNSGFGLRMIMATIERQFGGRVAFDWCGTGLRCTLHVLGSALSPYFSTEDGNTEMSVYGREIKSRNEGE